jgi:uncharacterized membrane protein
MQETRIPTISICANIWITIPIAALIAAILTANFLLLNYVHVFTSMLWTGTDIFMAFLLGPILRNVSLSTRKEVIFWLMPKMIFYMPTVAAVTTTAGYYLASRMGLITLHYFELRRNEPDMSKIQKLMRRYVKVVAMQAVSQFIIIFIMAEFATGFSLRL